MAEKLITKSFERLLDKGKHRGFITYEELGKSLGKRNSTNENLEKAFIVLVDEKITLVEKKSEFQSNKKKEVSNTSEEKTSDKSDDPIRMYLREMGGVELLSREGEIAIAKRIEAGKDVMINALTQSPIIGKKISEWKEQIENQQLLVRDIIDIDSTYEDFEASDDVDEVKVKKEKDKKDPKTYEHVDPELIGNHRNIIVSNQSGRSNILSRLEKYGVQIDSKDQKVQRILDEVKEREFSGYSYDGADASFELLANRLLGKVPEYLRVKSYDVNVSKEQEIKTKASVVFLIDGKEIECHGEGNGPVNALDNAIRSNFKKVTKYYNYFADLKLLDYKVRILNTGTEATTRVLIESTDKTGVSWFTVGVSPNIIEASFKALIDSLDYKLYKEKAPANFNEK